jgi:hypothetical protein
LDPLVAPVGVFIGLTLSVGLWVISLSTTDAGSVRVSVQKAKAVDEDGHRVVPSEETTLPDGERTVADELRIGLSELLRKAMIDQDADYLKEGVRVLSQALMEMEVQEHVGAGRHERSAGRTGQRNGYRERSWDTRVGTVELKVPGVRDSSYFPSLLEPRRKAERALSAVVQEAYVHGVSTRKVDELVKALRMRGISKSLTSPSCAKGSTRRSSLSGAGRLKALTPTCGSTPLTSKPARRDMWPRSRWS